MDYENKKIGLNVVGTDLKCKEVQIKIDEKIENRMNLLFGQRLTFEFLDVQGFKKEGSKIFPLMSIAVKDAKGKEVISSQDLVKEMKILNKNVKLIAFIDANLPSEDGPYTATISIQDKKGKGEMVATMPFSIQQDPKLKLEERGVSYSAIYLWNQEDQQIINSHEVESNRDYYIMIHDLEGISSPILPMRIIDGKGTVLLRDDNLLGTIEKKSADDFKRVPIRFTLSGDINNPVKIITSVQDSESDHIIHITTLVNVK
jgi:hypothetical protein